MMASAVNSDIGWSPIICKSQKWSRLGNKSNDRLNRKMSVWAHNARGRNSKNWNYKVENMFIKFGMIEHCDID